VTVQANTGPLPDPQWVSVKESGSTIASFAVISDTRNYSFYWEPSPALQWFRAGGGIELTLDVEARQLGGDARPLGIALTAFSASSVGGVSLIPIVWSMLTLLGLWFLIRPADTRGWVLFVGISLGLTVIYLALSWSPLIADSPWLPLFVLPTTVTLIIWGLVLARWRPGTTWRSAFPALALVALLIALIATMTLQWSVKGPDFDWHASHGSSFDRVFRAHNFYPFGFPLILWLGREIAGDPLFAGRLAAFVAATAAFSLTLLIAHRILGPRGAVSAGLLMLASPVFLTYGVVASTDIIGIVPLAGALLLLTWNRDLVARRVFWAGVLLGIAYLARYQAIFFVPLVIIWLVVQPLRPPEQWIERLKSRVLRKGVFLYGTLLLIAGFLLGSAPQWILDIRDTGAPFNTRQYENIWQAAYARTDPVIPAGDGLENEDTSPSRGGILDIVSFDPYTLVRHWAANLRFFFEQTMHELFIWPIGLLLLLALVLAFMQHTDPRIKLMLVLSLAYVPIIALTWNKDRFYLPIMPSIAVIGAWLISFLNERTLRLGRWQLSIGSAVQVLLVLWILQHLSSMESLLATHGNLT
jgi:hypothetical protein